MDESCSTVSTEIYWSAIALPLFIVILLFGIYVLFKLGGAHLAAPSSVLAKLATLRQPASAAAVAVVTK